MTLYYRCNQPRLERKGFCCCRIVMGYNMSVHMHKFIRKDNIVRKNPQNSWFELTRYIGSSIYVNRTKGTLTSTSIKSFTTMPPVCKPSLDLTPMMVLYNVKNSHTRPGWVWWLFRFGNAHSFSRICFPIASQIQCDDFGLGHQVTPVYDHSSSRNLIHVTKQISRTRWKKLVLGV